MQVNSLIDRGQLRRLATSSVFHANPMHLMVSFSSTIHPCNDPSQCCLLLSVWLNCFPLCVSINCYSLNSIGLTAESLGSPTRFLAVYFTSAIATVFVMRHKQMVRGGNENLMQIPQFYFAWSSSGLMNNISGEFQISGLLGGTAMAWLVGRHWKFEYTTRDGRRVFVDSVPAPLLLRW
ncbi:unnamed protein product [Brassica rapa subsp. trilocularis]